jgi:hypothetical protein
MASILAFSGWKGKFPGAPNFLCLEFGAVMPALNFFWPAITSLTGRLAHPSDHG